jgi:hypothetical protein
MRPTGNVCRARLNLTDCRLSLTQR